MWWISTRATDFSVLSVSLWLIPPPPHDNHRDTEDTENPLTK
jgi:hypothetical protein